LGVYTSDITIPHFPGEVMVSLALSFVPTEVRKERFDLVASLDGEILVSGTSEFQIVDLKRSFAVFQNIPLHLREKGILTFNVDAGGKSIQAWTGDVLKRD
jgi:hypothetical protein